MMIQPARAIRGTLKLPGDKSISHRAAMFAALAHGVTKIDNFASSADCLSTLDCLRALGVEIHQSGSTVVVTGSGKSGFKPPASPLDCGNSGTTMRLLSGILAGQNFESEVTGDESLTKRPMGRVIAPLLEMGARVVSEGGFAPLRISGINPLDSIEYTLPVASAQIKSCILLAALNASGRTTVVEPTPTRDHSERMLRWFGVDVLTERAGGQTRLTVSGDAVLNARDIEVPSDISSAAFFIAAAACLPGSAINIENVGLNPSRTAVLDAFGTFGVDVEIAGRRELGNEPAGNIIVKGGLAAAADRNSNLIAGGVIANLIDEVPILGVFGTQLEKGLEVRDAAELRVKESDRISAVVENLKRMGADIEEFDDGFKVERSRLRGAQVDSFGDHRIAMAFAVAGLLAEGETEITGAECAAVSFPEFFDVLADVVV